MRSSPRRVNCIEGGWISEERSKGAANPVQHTLLATGTFDAGSGLAPHDGVDIPVSRNPVEVF